ncbi:MAG: hypothetical protein ACHBN1_22980 [Heteroscytonema crispum UTEX LB 1556]
MTSNSSQKDSYVSLDFIIKTITVFTFLFYIVGVFTVNSYLYELNFSAISSPLKPRFIYTGIVVLSSLAFSFLFPYIFILHLKSSGLSKHWYFILCVLIIIFPALAYLSINYAFVFFLSNPNSLILKPTISLSRVIFYSIWSVLTGAIVCFVITQIYPIFPNSVFPKWLIRKSQAQNSQSWYLKVVVSFFLIPVISMYITFFGHKIYALIPEQFGGGQPKIVQFLFKKNMIQQVKVLGLDIEDSGLSSPSQTIAIFFEEEKYYVLGIYAPKKQEIKIKTLGDGKIRDSETKEGKIIKDVVQLDKSLVAGVKLIGYSPSTHS